MGATILTGDALEVLRTLEAESVQCCVTSPPYWGLRDYGVAGQLGLERTPEEYVARMVEVFREVRRVLRQDGVLWLNLGDSYAHSGCGARDAERWPKQARNDHMPQHAKRGRRLATVGEIDGKHHTRGGEAVPQERIRVAGLKPKDLVGIPWRVAFALQADGWWLRSDVIWSKPNPMPESVRDRPTRAHEYLFLLTKGESYFYDAGAVAEPASPALNDRWDAARDAGAIAPTRNKRSVWTIGSQPFPDAHFAVMPEALAEPCVLAGSGWGATVLDPFAGSGTVGVVALKHGRSFLGIDLNLAYAAMARERIAGDAPLLNRVPSGCTGKGGG